MRLCWQTLLMVSTMYLASWYSEAVTKKAKFTIEPSYTLNCVEAINVRFWMECSSKATDNLTYNFAFKFRDAQCWICRGDGTQPCLTLTEYSQSDVYVTGMGTWNDNAPRFHTHRLWYKIDEYILVIDIIRTITKGMAHILITSV